MVSNDDLIDLFNSEAYESIRSLIMLLHELGIDNDTENLPLSLTRSEFVDKYCNRKI